MKKQFLTFALLTTMVAGGAVAQQTIYQDGNSNLVLCDAAGLSCSAEYGSIGYTVPFPNPDPEGPQQGEEGTEVNLDVLEFTP